MKKIIFFNIAILAATIQSCGGLKSKDSHKNHISRVVTQTYWHNKEKNDSTLQMEFETIGDLLDGTVKSFYRNGVLKSKTIFSRNKLISVIVQNDTLGKKLDFGSIENGNGCVNQYSYEGYLNFKGCYKNGLREGVWTYYNFNGLEVYKVHFKKGICKEFPTTSYTIFI